MNASLQEQLKQIRTEVRKLEYNQETKKLETRVRRWVVWTKRGEEISRFCTFDSHEEVCDE